MTERGGVERERVDPRYDPAFQRGFAGGVDRVRGDERAYARPGTAGAGAGVAPVRRAAGLAEIATTADGRRARRAAATPPDAPPARLPSEADDVQQPWEPFADTPREEAPPRPVAVAEPDAPLLRNPWLLALLLAGLAGSAIGLALLYTGYSSPPASYYGDSDTPSPAWIQRQILYYASIPLLGCLPFSILLALGVAAFRWRRRPVAELDEDQTPEAPNSSPSR